MRAVIQRVANARVVIRGERERVSAIGPGLVILLGIEATDNQEDGDWLASKISKMRLFPDEEGKMNRSLEDAGGEVLVVSQFTLHASTKKGNRPSFLRAAGPAHAKPLYRGFVAGMESALRKPVREGEFGAEMEVTIVNDGPVTIWIDSQAKE